MYDLIKNDPERARNPVARIRVQGRELLVRNEITSADAVFISAPLPQFLIPDLTRDDIAAALRIPPGEITEKNKITQVNAGLTTLIVSLTSLDTLLSLRPDQKVPARVLSCTWYRNYPGLCGGCFNTGE